MGDPTTEKVIETLLNQSGYAWEKSRSAYLSQSWCNPVKKISRWIHQYHADIVFVAMVSIYDSYINKSS